MNLDNNNENSSTLWANGKPILKITSLSTDALSNNNPVPIIKSQEEFSCTVNLTDESSAALWAICEGLEIIDGGENNV